MKLQDEQFFVMVAALGCGSGGLVGEHRAQVRVPMGTRATIIPCSEGGRREPVTVMVMNVSETGIGFVSSEHLQTGDNFILRLPPTGNQPAAAILCGVVHGNLFATGMYIAGAQFTRVLTTAGAQAKEVQPFQNAAELLAEDIAHLRHVENRLSGLMMQ